MRISIGVVLLLTLLSGSTRAEEAPTPPTQTQTIERLYAAFRKAIEEKDWKKAVGMMSSKSRAQLCIVAMNRSLDAVAGEEPTPKAKIMRLFWENRKVLEYSSADRLADSGVNTHEILVTLIEKLDFDLMPVLKPELDGLKIEGDRAWAIASFLRDEAPRRTYFGFARVGIAWRIHMPRSGWAVKESDEDTKPDPEEWEEPEAVKKLPGFADAQGEADLKKMQGRWRIVSLMVDGEQSESDPDGNAKGSWTIDGNRTIYLSTGRWDRMQLTGAKKPGWMDVRAGYDDESINNLKAIYEIDGDTMRICVDVEEKDRPDDFTAKTKSNRRSFILQRMK